MSNTNDFVPFCNENTGTNLPTQSAYLANPNLPLGNQPGIASSSLNNKALRQGSTMAAVLAQTVSNLMAVDMLDNQNTADHAIPTALLNAMMATVKRLNPVQTIYNTPGATGNHNLTFKFFIATPTVNPASGATYSDGTTTYTVTVTYDGTELKATGNANPAATSGTLTKVTGTGDATLTFYAYRKPLFLKVQLVGAGGGGSGSGNSGSGGRGNTGSNTTFGTLTGSAGQGGYAGGAYGSTSTGGAASGGDLNINGNNGAPPPGANITNNFYGGNGGNSFFGAGGPGGLNGGGVGGAATGVGAGGGGAGGNTGVGCWAGGGGGSGGFVQATITSPGATYAYGVGTGGAGGGAGTGGNTGGAGGGGFIYVEEHYQ